MEKRNRLKLKRTTVQNLSGIRGAGDVGSQFCTILCDVTQGGCGSLACHTDPPACPPDDTTVTDTSCQACHTDLCPPSVLVHSCPNC